MSRAQRGYPSSRGIIRLSIVAPGWLSLPCQSQDLVGISPTNTTSMAYALVPQFATTGPLKGPSLQLGESDSTCAFRPRLAFVMVLNFFRSDPAVGSESLGSCAGTRSRSNPGAGSSPSVALWGSNLVTANALSCLRGGTIGGRANPYVVQARGSCCRSGKGLSPTPQLDGLFTLHYLGSEVDPLGTQVFVTYQIAWSHWGVHGSCQDK